MSQRMVLGLAGGLTGLMLAVAAVVTFTFLTRPAAAAQAQVAPLPAAAVPPVVQAAPQAAPQSSAQSDPQAALSADVAAQIALNVAPGAQLAQTPDLVSYNGTVAYEVKLDRGTIYVDANTGKILSDSVQQPATGQFGGRGGHEGAEHESQGFDD